MKVLSLFDWMSCGLLALQRAWIVIETYYASEVDKYAIQISQKNHPNIIQLWDVNNRKEWDLWEIDLIIGWSPCQWFSIAWKQLAFDDPRSKLFFTMADIINHYKPKYFLLENVKMKKEFQEIITQYMWVSPIEINSSLVSAQNRRRLYWTNIQWVEQPKDKWIFLNDILEESVEEKYYMTEKQYKNLSFEALKRLYTEKAPTLDTMQWWHRQPKINIRDETFTPFNQDNIFVWKEDKVPTLTAWDWWNRPKMYDFDDMIVRKLTPLECERLQTLPDNYTEWVSNSQRYKMIGNWRTVDVIAHIFSYIR